MLEPADRSWGEHCSIALGSLYASGSTPCLTSKSLLGFKALRCWSLAVSWGLNFLSLNYDHETPRGLLSGFVSLRWALGVQLFILIPFATLSFPGQTAEVHQCDAAAALCLQC